MHRLLNRSQLVFTGLTVLSFVSLVRCGPLGEEGEIQVRVVDAREVGLLEQSPRISGRDGGFSTRLWGKSVWIYGDTFLDRMDEKGRTLIENSFSFTTDQDASNGIGSFSERSDSVGMPRMLIEPTAQEEAYNLAHLLSNCLEEPCGARYGAWPVEPVWDESNSRALMFYSLFRAEPGAWNFEVLGAGITEWRDLEKPAERLVSDHSVDTPELMWFGDEPVPSLGPQIIDGQMYGFACPLESLRRPCKLARAPLESLTRRDSWTWFDGNGWTKDPGAAQELFEGNVAMSVSYNEYLHRWTAVYARIFEDSIEMRTAPELTGPWSEPTELFVGEDGDDERWIYDALSHADYQQEGGRILYVSFSRPIPGRFLASELPIVRVELE